MQLEMKQANDGGAVTPTNDHAEEAWYRKHVDRSRHEHSILPGFRVTPAHARVLLARNIKNRSMVRNRVKHFMSVIGRGEWCKTHQGIAVDWFGNLLDGQHRLQAIVESDTPCELDVHFGLDPASFDRIDVGAVRSVANVLEIGGAKHASIVGAIVRILLAIEDGKKFVHGGTMSMAVSRHSILELVEERKDLGPSTEIALAIKTAMKTMPSVPGMGAAVYLIRKRMGPYEPQPFFDAVRTGLKVKGETDPVYRLRLRLQSGEKMQGLQVAAFTIKAFNAWLDEKPVHQFRWTAVEPFPRVGE